MNFRAQGWEGLPGGTLRGVDSAFARTMWQELEPLHAVTYFAPESRDANRAVGLRGFWMGYFASRAAPLGEVAPAVVEATFHNFHPVMVRRALPGAWRFARPAAVVRARTEAAAAALRRLAPGVQEAAGLLVPPLDRAVAAADAAGRPLFAANRDLPAVDDPVCALWQAATSLREHRGDGHVAVLTAEGLDGCEVHLLLAATEGVPDAVLRDNRGWSQREWDAGRARLHERGLLDASGHPTTAGRTLRAHIEIRTDALAVRPYAQALTAAEADRLPDLLRTLAARIAASGVIPYPNPMGLPPPAPKPSGS